MSSGTTAIKELEAAVVVEETVEEEEVASEEVSKIPEATTSTAEEAETSIKEVATMLMLVVEEASITRWEIPQEDSNLKTTSHKIPEVVVAAVPITKLLCADILNFVSNILKLILFLDGNCRYENKCSYAHGEAELR